MSDLIKKPAGHLSLASSLRSGLAESVASTPVVSGKPFLRLLKSGRWVFGQGDDPVQDGSDWAVNPGRLMHGYTCWSNDPAAAKNEKLGEVMVPMTSPKPARPEPIQGYPYVESRGAEMKCLTGTDKGEEVLYVTQSLGGLQAVTQLCNEIIAKIDIDPTHFVPVVQLGADSYKHPKYGEIYKPVLEVVGWLSMEGEPSPGEPVEAVSEVRTPKPPIEQAVPPEPLRAGIRRQRPAAR